MNELNTMAQPSRKAKEKQFADAESRAYERAYTETRKALAQQEGAAAGAADAASAGSGAVDIESAVERARQRALGGGSTPPAALNRPVATAISPATKLSGEFIKRPDGSKVPIEYFDLPDEQKARFDALLKEEESEAADESLALQYSKRVGDQQASDAKRITNLERLVESLVGENMELRRRQDNIDLTVEVAKSEALEDQVSSVALMTTNLLTVKLQASAEMEAYSRQRELAAEENRSQLEAQARAIEALRGSVKSTTTLMSERSNVVLDQLVAIEGRVAKAEVNQTEIDNGIKANRQTLKAVTGDDLKSVVDMNVKQAFDDRLEPAMEELIARRYVTTAPTTGLDGCDDKRDDSAKPFLAEQVGDNATERAVNRALKKGRRG